jgi:TatD DNase family protein
LTGYIDTHCHLDHIAFDHDRNEVINHAKSTGIDIIIDPAVDFATSRKAVDLVQDYKGLYAAVGIHPNDIQTTWKDDLVKIEDLLIQDGIVAIGEIGLDQYHQEVPIDLQIKCLSAQLLLAKKKQLPVILHSRNTLPIIHSILAHWVLDCKKDNWQVPYGVMHAFEGDLQSALLFIEMGFLIGLGGPLTYKNAKDKQELAKHLPLSSILLETDSPYLSPDPHRGQRNVPAYLPYIGQRAAIIRGCNEMEVVNATHDNAVSLFRFGAM